MGFQITNRKEWHNENSFGRDRNLNKLKDTSIHHAAANKLLKATQKILNELF